MAPLPYVRHRTLEPYEAKHRSLPPTPPQRVAFDSSLRFEHSADVRSRIDEQEGRSPPPRLRPPRERGLPERSDEPICPLLADRALLACEQTREFPCSSASQTALVSPQPAVRGGQALRGQRPATASVLTPHLRRHQLRVRDTNWATSLARNLIDHQLAHVAQGVTPRP